MSGAPAVTRAKAIVRAPLGSTMTTLIVHRVLRDDTTMLLCTTPLPNAKRARSHDISRRRSKRRAFPAPQASFETLQSWPLQMKRKRALCVLQGNSSPQKKKQHALNAASVNIGMYWLRHPRWNRRRALHVPSMHTRTRPGRRSVNCAVQANIVMFPQPVLKPRHCCRHIARLTVIVPAMHRATQQVATWMLAVI